MAPNQTYIEKADLAVSNIINEGGYLVPEQAKRFMELLIEDSVLLGMVTMLPMKSPTYEISKMGFTGRVLRRAAEGQALPKADRVKPELGKVQLTTTEMIAEARIPYQVLEDNIEQGTFQDTMMGFLSKAVSRDLEEVVISGDTASSTDPLFSFDGLLKQQTTLVYNAGGVRLTKSVMKVMMQILPSRYLKSQSALAFITSKNAHIDYTDSLSNRQTPLGDSALMKKAGGIEYNGYPVVPIPMWPENLGANTNMTTVTFADPKNLNVGVMRNVRVETDKDISAREYIVVATLRAGTKWAHEPATVKTTNVLASPGV